LQRLGWVLMAAVLVASCSPPKAQPLHFDAAPWQAGEMATYDVVIDGKPAGNATFAVDSRASSEGGWIFVRDITALGSQEIASMELRDDSYKPTQSTLVRLDNGDVEQVKATYNGGQANLELTTVDKIVTYQSISIPTDARDQRSLPLIVRTLPLADGYSTRLNAFLPLTGNLDRVTVSVVNQARVTVPAGTYDTWEVLLEGQETYARLWIAVDPPHALVKFVDGRSKVTHELRSYEPSSADSLQ
jgi:hypothetical protein